MASFIEAPLVNNFYEIGRVGEHESRAVNIYLDKEPYTTWFSKWGKEGTFTGLYRRNGDEAGYPVTIINHIDATRPWIRWIPRDVDVAKGGHGKLQFMYSIENGYHGGQSQVVASDIILTNVKEGLTPGEAPDGWETFLDGKQDKLTAGEGITIDEDNVISSTGGGGGIQTITGTNGISVTGTGSSRTIQMDMTHFAYFNPYVRQIVNYVNLLHTNIQFEADFTTMTCKIFSVDFTQNSGTIDNYQDWSSHLAGLFNAMNSTEAQVHNDAPLELFKVIELVNGPKSTSASYNTMVLHVTQTKEWAHTVDQIPNQLNPNKNSNVINPNFKAIGIYDGITYEFTFTYNSSTNKYSWSKSVYSDIFWCEYGVTTVEEVEDAIANNKILALKRSTYTYMYIMEDDSYYYFASPSATAVRRCYIKKSDGSWQIGAQNLQKKLTSTTATVSFTAGSSTATVSVTGVKVDNNLIVSPAPASVDAWSTLGVYCSAQAAGSLTFTALRAPSVVTTVTANILIAD